MDELQKKIDEATSRILAAQRERAAREASANAHEQAAREDRLAMGNLKQEIEELNTILRHAGVQKATEDATAAARRAQAEAEKANVDAAAVLVSLKAKEKQLDELLAKAAKPE